MKNKIYVSLLIFSGFWLGACQKADYKGEFGNSLLYMPQAVVQSGGTNNNYFVVVKSSVNADTSIAVGLYRSGLETLQSVSVDLVLDADTLQKAIDISKIPGAESKYDIYKNAKLMPADYYTVPTKLSLNDNVRESYEPLKIDKSKLLIDPDFGTKVFIIPLRIKNPTRYSLNEKLSLTMFIFQ